LLSRSAQDYAFQHFNYNHGYAYEREFYSTEFGPQQSEGAGVRHGIPSIRGKARFDQARGRNIAAYGRETSRTRHMWDSRALRERLV